MTIEQFSRLLRSKFENFRWETMPQNEALSYFDDLKNDLLTYYHVFRKRSVKYGG